MTLRMEEVKLMQMGCVGSQGTGWSPRGAGEVGLLVEYARLRITSYLLFVMIL